MLIRGETTEDRIAKIAQGFEKGLQNFQGQQDRSRTLSLQDEARKRQNALQALETSAAIGNQTGRFVDPSDVAPFINSGNLSGLGEILKSAPLTRKAEIENEARDIRTQRDSADLKLKQAQAEELTKPFKETREYKKAIAVSKVKSSANKDNQEYQATDNIRKEISGLPATKDIVNIDSALSKIRTAPANAAGDMSKIFAYMKILDPGSTVREGEFANAEQARGIDSSILGLYNKTLKGERLTPAQRAEFDKAAEGLARSQYQTYMSVTSPQRKRVSDLGLDSSQIFPQFSQQSIYDSVGVPTTQTPPQQRITDQAQDARYKRMLELKAKAGG